MKRFRIAHYKSLEKVNLYTVHFNDEKDNETDKFIKRFINHPDHKEDLQIIIEWISRIGEKGAFERYFRPERRAVAIPIVSAGLRLYCVRVSDELLILGNGGIKTSKNVNDSPDCLPHFNCMNDVQFLITNSREKGETLIEGKQLTGKLNFYLKN